MQYRAVRKNGAMGGDGLLRNLLVTLFVSVFSFCILTPVVSAALKKPESPKNVILIKDYKWQSGGMGTVGIIKEIRLENKGKRDYKNVEIEVDLYTTNDIPLGSLRSTIHDVLEAGSEKTFYNVNFGFMHSELQKTVLRVVGAEVVEKGPPSLPRDLILVKNWEWTGGQYSTEGILKEITLENKSGNHYKDIKIKVDNLGVGGSGKVGYEGYTSRVVIHDVLPARSTRTFRNVNVGFKHPDTKETYISVMDATQISAKELNYRLAEKGEPIKKQAKRVAKKTEGETGEKRVQGAEGGDTKGSPKLTLAERYRQKLAQKGEEGISNTPPSGGKTPSESSKKVESEVASISPKEKETASTEPGEESGSQEGVMGRRSRIKKGITGLFKGGSQETEEKGSSKGEAEVLPAEEKASAVLEAPEEEEEAIPKDDIVVKDFEWGGGIAGTIGVLNEITLENRSGITYRNIQIEIEFYSSSPRRPIGSNRITIYDVLPPNSEKVFRDLKVGFLNAVPDDVIIRVVDAAAAR